MNVDKVESLDKRRCKVFLDGDFAFVLYRGEIKRYKIEAGEELSETVYGQIFREIICRRTRERALYLLQFSGRTEEELKRKLISSFYPEKAVEETITFLKRYHYLDDMEYARNYIEVNGKRKSRAELMNTLRHKGVGRECIEALLSEQEPDEQLQVKHLLEKRRYSDSMSPDEKRKTIAFLMRKGFSYETVRSVMGTLKEDEFFD